MIIYLILRLQCKHRETFYFVLHIIGKVKTYIRLIFFTYVPLASFLFASCPRYSTENKKKSLQTEWYSPYEYLSQKQVYSLDGKHFIVLVTTVNFWFLISLCSVNSGQTDKGDFYYGRAPIFSSVMSVSHCLTALSTMCQACAAQCMFTTLLCFIMMGFLCACERMTSWPGQ